MRLLHMKIPQVSDEKRKLAIFRKFCEISCWQGLSGVSVLTASGQRAK